MLLSDTLFVGMTVSRMEIAMCIRMGIDVVEVNSVEVAGIVTAVIIVVVVASAASPLRLTASMSLSATSIANTTAIIGAIVA